MNAYEINFDSIVGPTHNYSGLSLGNLASMDHARQVSHPKAAALEGLEKMHTLASLGIKQAVLPPQERPYMPLMHALGYRDLNELPAPLLMAISSAACMWAANAATVCPSADAADGKVHFTPANLTTKLHRMIEAPATAKTLKLIFKDPAFFVHHDPLPSHPDFSDEGAANHTRLCRSYHERGIQLFVYGRSAWSNDGPMPKKFPARQTLEASQAIARRHGLDPQQVVFAQQNPDAIDAGVFHNDVVSVGNQNVFFYHESAFVNTDAVIKAVQEKMDFFAIKVTEKEIPLKIAVATYLFNSQLVTLAPEKMALIAPMECADSPIVQSYLKELLARTNIPIKEIVFQRVRQSMQNGGGPACLRLRIVLTENELSRMHQGVLLTDSLYETLKKWIHNHYRDKLSPQDLIDEYLIQESKVALEELMHILGFA